jgi:UDP-glucose 4-epimerase
VSFTAGDISEWHHVVNALRDARPYAVVHCAAIVGVLASATAPFSAFRINVDGMVHLLEGMKLLGIGRLVNISSEEVYGHFQSDSITEDHPCRPLMPYGISKFAAEQLARGYVRRDGLQCIHVRTCWVYGPGLPRPRVPKILVDAAVNGTALHLPTGGDFRVDHVYIDDVVSGVLAVLEKAEHTHDVYHIASGSAPSLTKIVAVIKDIEPEAQISVGPGEYRFDASTEVVHKGILDISRARAELGYSPRFDIVSGLRSYMEASRAARAGGRQ